MKKVARVARRANDRPSAVHDTEQPPWLAHVAKATVWLPRLRGQGVLVPGGFVLTAAHCVGWSASGGMAVGEHFVEPIEPKRGPAFKLSVYAVEPVADIAVLGEADEQVFPDDAEAFQAFCDSTTAVPVCVEDGPRGVPTPAHVLTHHGKWVKGTLREGASPHVPLGAKAWLEARLEGGTSGGPIVNDLGQLVGLVSWTTEEPFVTDIPMTPGGGTPRPHRALPSWLWSRIEVAQSDRRTIMEIDDRTKCRFKGEEMDLGDARMMLTKAELEEVEVTLADGSVIRPFRFNEVSPVIGSGKNGILSF